ncbi:MAG: sigma-70 family RNA polymerase sigma factor [Planctomycetes bacterium]|nr:sigma-70 family RNA polymerase sigma factor [Planctomycetota bacterium]
MKGDWQTRQTLLQRAKDPSDESAWLDFVSYYESFIRMIILKMNISASESDDITQDVLLSIWKNLKGFESDSNRAKFRTWLSTIVRNRVLNHIRDRQSHHNRMKNVKKEWVEEGKLISQSELEEVIEKDWKRHITKLALNNISKHFSGVAVNVFEMSLRGVENKQIAAELNLADSSVRTLKSRVQQSLVKEVAHLIQELEA